MIKIGKNNIWKTLGQEIFKIKYCDNNNNLIYLYYNNNIIYRLNKEYENFVIIITKPINVNKELL